MKAPKKSPIDSLISLVKRAPKGPPPVGVTPHTVVWTENKWRLLRFSPARPKFATPVLLVPSLINRWYVLDLGPQRSLIEWLVAQGHDVFCIDWGTPGDEDRYLTWDDIAGRYIGRAVRIASRFGRTSDVHLLGYCLGGTLAVTYAAAFPIESVLSAARFQSQVFIVAMISALSLLRSSAFFARSPSARSSIAYSSPIHFIARWASG